MELRNHNPRVGGSSPSSATKFFQGKQHIRTLLVMVFLSESARPVTVFVSTALCLLLKIACASLLPLQITKIFIPQVAQL